MNTDKLNEVADELGKQIKKMKALVNQCEHKWIDIWSGDPDNQTMDYEGQKCEKCKSTDYPI